MFALKSYLSFCPCVYVFVQPPPTPSPACLRSLLACLMCCDCPDPLHPQDRDPPLPSYPSSARSSLTPLQEAVERPQTTLPLSSLSPAPLGHWTKAIREPLGAESLSERGSVAALSCSTPTPSEGIDVRWLLQNPRRRHRSRYCCCCCSCLVQCLRRNLNL